MGYARLTQATSGIHTRLYSRAFIISNNNERIVYVTADLGFISQAIKVITIERLQKIFGSLYTDENVMIAATHTHSGPGGYCWYPMYGMNSFGFNYQNFDIIVNGIVKSIEIAHNNLSKGNIFIGSGEILNASYNRSPTAYYSNPSEELKNYEYNFDPEVLQLRFQVENNTEIGIINWFAVHGTSMKGNNTLISGDNKGYAAYLMEKVMNNNNLGSREKFVAAFAQTNEGDISPNTKGAFCEDGSQCDEKTSSCNGWTQGCNSIGPGNDPFESTEIIGKMQFEKALDIFHNSKEIVKGEIKYSHAWVNIEELEIPPEFTGLNKTIKTCIGALGDSMAAGTVDGPGDFNFVQGTTSTSPLNSGWHWLTETVFGKIPEEQKQCHYPKPILFYTGRIGIPSKWTQGVVPVQLFKLGDIWIAGVPAEFTTMAGRRLKNRIKNSLISLNALNENTKIIISGLSNSYTHYVTTKEEYDNQRYEGASTLYGPYTLSAYEMLFSQMVHHIIKNDPLPKSSKPEDLRNTTFSMLPNVIIDTAPDNDFGRVFQDSESLYKPGDEVIVKFWSANPRNNPRTNDTYLTVERFENNEWKVIATDNDWETKYIWSRKGVSRSIATIIWQIPEDIQAGTYRIRHFGDAKYLSGEIKSFVGESKKFIILRY